MLNVKKSKMGDVTYKYSVVKAADICIQKVCINDVQKRLYFHGLVKSLFSYVKYFVLLYALKNEEKILNVYGVHI